MTTDNAETANGRPNPGNPAPDANRAKASRDDNAAGGPDAGAEGRMGASARGMDAGTGGRNAGEGAGGIGEGAGGIGEGAASDPFRFRPDLDDRLRAALAEDHGPGDVTSRTTLPETARGIGVIRAKAGGVLCGQEVARRVFRLVDPELNVVALAADGERVVRGRAVLRVEGRLRSIFGGERLALNFLQRMGGVATLTRQYVDARPPGSNLQICDTRKTTPLWRDLERYAVRTGGGTNHRWGLWDMVMIKDTHADACGGLGEALRRVREADAGVPVAAEARTLDEARLAAETGVDILMLDNMSEDDVARTVEELGGRCVFEITGGVTPERIPRLAALGVDRVSIGALTHSAVALDMSLTFDRG